MHRNEPLGGNSFKEARFRKNGTESTVVAQYIDFETFKIFFGSESEGACSSNSTEVTAKTVSSSYYFDSRPKETHI